MTISESDLTELIGAPVAVQVTGPILICGPVSENGQLVRFKRESDGKEFGKPGIATVRRKVQLPDGNVVEQETEPATPLLLAELVGVTKGTAVLVLGAESGTKVQIRLRLDSIIAVTSMLPPSRLVL